MAFDSTTANVISAVANPFAVVRKRKANTTITALDPDEPLLVVVHETPDKLKNLVVAGRIRLVFLTVFETDSIPESWQAPLLSCDEIWVPTAFNQETFSRAGIPASMIRRLPHCLDNAFFKNTADPIDIPGLNGFVFTSIVSNFNRKDLGSLLRGYFKAFTGDDDVSLVIKLPPSTKVANLDRFVRDAIAPEYDVGDPNLPHVRLLVANLSEERLRGLYTRAQAYVAIERGKGWDLPALEAMALGTPTIGVDWSGNTEFQTPENSLLIKPQPSLVAVDETLVTNLDLYGGHSWSTVSIEDVAKALIEARDNHQFWRATAERTAAEIRERYSEDSVGRQLAALITDLPSHAFRGPKNRTRLVWDTARDPIEIRPAQHKDVPDVEALEPDAFAPYTSDEAVDDYIDRRRDLFSRHGSAILPPPEERLRTGSLAGRHFGEEIVIVGNGPSLRQINWEVLKQYRTFAANRIYLAYDKTDWRPDFYACLDWRVTPDNYAEINALTRSGGGTDDTTFFFPNRFRGLLRESPDVYWYESQPPGATVLEKFETNATRAVRGGGTILVACLQLAYHMGFRRFHMIGVDLNYQVPSSVIQSGGDRFGTGIQINLESTADDDPNHFDNRYFGKGARWHDPNTDEMHRGFLACRQALEILGGEITNAGLGGNLTAFRRHQLPGLFPYGEEDC